MTLGEAPEFGGGTVVTLWLRVPSRCRSQPCYGSVVGHFEIYRGFTPLAFGLVEAAEPPPAKRGPYKKRYAAAS
jgi:hypothetical protein